MVNKIHKEYAIPIKLHLLGIGKALLSLLVTVNIDWICRSISLGKEIDEFDLTDFEDAVFGGLRDYLDYIHFSKEVKRYYSFEDLPDEVWKMDIGFKQNILTVSAKSFLNMVLYTYNKIKDTKIDYQYSNFELVNIFISTENNEIHNQTVYMTNYVLFRQFLSAELKKVKLINCVVKGKGVYRITDYVEARDLVGYCKDNKHIIFDIGCHVDIYTVNIGTKNKCMGFYAPGKDIVYDMIMEFSGIKDEQQRKNALFCLKDINMDPADKLMWLDSLRRKAYKFVNFTLDDKVYLNKLRYYAYKKD